jgi:hypothetical protein
MAPSQVEEICTTWFKNFEIPFGNGFGKEQFLASYDPNIQWFDHAFMVRHWPVMLQIFSISVLTHILQVQRQGHEAILGLREAFLHCNDPFHSKLKV